MFEFDKYDERLDREPPSVPTTDVAPDDDVARLSFLVWGEHCVECAAPACFSTCDLYEARPDRRCRRFVFGTLKNRLVPSLRGYGAEIVFKKWAKLEARGNTLMQSRAAVIRRERLIGVLLPLLNALGALVYRFTRDLRWSHVSHSWLERMARRLHRKSAKGEPPDAFLLEVYNPGPVPLRLQLTMSVARKEVDGNPPLPPPFTATVELPPGPSRHVVERVRFQSVAASGLPFDVALIPEADNVLTRLIVLTADFVRFRPAAGATGKRPDIKCVAFDLDNTLWEGILLENSDVELRPGVKPLLETLDRRGILLSVVSKNEHDHVWPKLEELGVADYFLHPQINWMPKSQNVKRLAERLNIGIDTFAFVDDNPFELEEVQSVLPEVECIPVEELTELENRPRFKGSASVEARHRRRFYRDAIQREQVQQTYGEDYLGFLASCGIRLKVRPHGPADFDRVTELVQRTNQLNFSGRKYTRDEVKQLIEDGRIEKYVIECADRFGSYGTVGFSLVRREPDAVTVDDFMLSCRVQGKFVEQAFFSLLMNERNPDSAPRLIVNYKKTERNTPAWNVLHSLHFEPLADGAGVTLDTRAHPLGCDFIEVEYEGIRDEG